MSSYDDATPISSVLPRWPSDLLKPRSESFIDKLRIDLHYEPFYRGTDVYGQLFYEEELAFDVPWSSSTEIVFLATKNASDTSVGFHAAIWDDSYKVILKDLSLGVRFKADIIKPVKRDGDQWIVDTEKEQVQIDLLASLKADPDGVSFAAPPGLSIAPFMIGNTGIVVEAEALQLIFRREDATVLPLSIPRTARGAYLKKAVVYFPEGMSKLLPDDIVLEDFFIGRGGFYGKITGDWNPRFNAAAGKFEDTGSGSFFGVPFGLRSIDVEFVQNTFKESSLKGDLLLPFFDKPLQVEISIDTDGGLSVALSAEADPLTELEIKFRDEILLKLLLESIEIDIDDGDLTVTLNGEISSKFEGLDWPTFEVRELKIDSKGNVHLDGGWLDLPKAYTLDLAAFKLEITKLGFGTTSDGGKYVAFSGGVDLVKGLPAGVAVEGARIIWYDDGRKPGFTLNGVGVELKIPGKLDFKGVVSYEKEGELRAFKGDITLNLPAVNQLALNGKIVFGSLPDKSGKRFRYFALYVEGEFGTGIPLWATGLSLYGIAGLLAVNYAPDVDQGMLWYSMDKSKSWYHKRPVGVTDLLQKWAPDPRTLGIGAGVAVATTLDKGFKFHGNFLLLLLFPGPIFMLDGRVNVLKERSTLNEDPQFHALIVLDARAGYFLVGIDAKWKSDEEKGTLAEIAGSAELFFDFKEPRNWHFYLGKKEPRDQRIAAVFASLFRAEAYFMLDSKSLGVGVWFGREDHFKWGPVKADLEAWLDANALLSFNPAQFHAGLWLHGYLAARVFKFKLGIGLDARLTVDLFKPFHIVGELQVKIDTPLKDFKVRVRLEWGPRPQRPVVPPPYKDWGVKHLKTTAEWRLEPATAEPQLVPVDGRPYVTFQHPVADGAGIGVNTAPAPPPMVIGDPTRGEGSARVTYSLDAVILRRRDGGKWKTIGKKPSAFGEYEWELYGSWAAVPRNATESAASGGQNQLLIWSKNPLDHTSNGEGWNVWLEDNLRGYPCPVVEPRTVCVDFEDYGQRTEVYGPWADPRQPEIRVEWQGGAVPVVAIRNPVDGQTRGLWFSWPEAGPIVFVANPESNEVQVADISTGMLASPVAVGKQPYSVALTPDGSKCVVVHDQQGARALFIDTRTLEVTGPQIPLLPDVRDVVVTPDGKKAYVTSGSSEGLMVLDVNEQKRHKIIRLIEQAQGLAVAPDGSEVYVVHPTSSRVSVVDTSNDTVVGIPFEVPGHPRSIAVASPFALPHTGGWRLSLKYLAYLPGSDSDSLAVLGLPSGTVADVVSLGEFPTDIALTPAGETLYVTNAQSQTVSVISAFTMKVIASIPIPGFLSSVTVTSDGKYAVVSSSLGTLTLIDTSDNTVVRTIDLKGRPRHAAVSSRPMRVTEWPLPPLESSQQEVYVDLPAGTALAEILFMSNPGKISGYVVEPAGVESREHAPTDYRVRFDADTLGVGELRRLRLVSTGGWILLRVCVTLLPSPSIVREVAEVREHLERQTALLELPGEVLDAEKVYRLDLKVRRQIQGLGSLKSWKQDKTFPFRRIFKTSGPPGVGSLSTPSGSGRGGSGLEDLTLYVDQTVPLSVPPTGERPAMTRPVYRAYDVGIRFNENYVAAMYEQAGRPLRLFLYDQNNRLVSGEDGKALAVDPSWEQTSEAAAEDERWLAVLGAADCLSKVPEPAALSHNETLTVSSPSHVLEPDSVYEARLVPLPTAQKFPGKNSPVVYRFQFTTSRYANFIHHLQSFDEAVWDADLAQGFKLAEVLPDAVKKPSAAPSEAEARSFDRLAEAALGPAAWQLPEQLEVTRLTRNGVRAFLFRSPEPLDWRRVELKVFHRAASPKESRLTRLVPSPAGKKLSVLLWRSADQTSLILARPNKGKLLPGVYRLEWTYHRSRPGVEPLLHQAGVSGPEQVTLLLRNAS